MPRGLVQQLVGMANETEMYYASPRETARYDISCKWLMRHRAVDDHELR